MTQDSRPLTVQEAAALLQALQDDGAHPMARHLDDVSRDAEQALKERGLLQEQAGSDRLELHPDVRYSLDRSSDT